MADNFDVILEIGYELNFVRREKRSFHASERLARVHLEDMQNMSGVKLVYAKIRKIRYLHDICIKYDDKGEPENEFYINPNKKA